MRDVTTTLKCSSCQREVKQAQTARTLFYLWHPRENSGLAQCLTLSQKIRQAALASLPLSSPVSFKQRLYNLLLSLKSMVCRVTPRGRCPRMPSDVISRHSLGGGASRFPNNMRARLESHDRVQSSFSNRPHKIFNSTIYFRCVAPKSCRRFSHVNHESSAIILLP